MPAAKPRSLNMTEKRKLENLLIEDIDRAAKAYSDKMEDERDILIKKLNAQPPADAKALLALYKKARKEADDAESKLAAAGWETTGHGDDLTLQVEEYKGRVRPQALQVFDDAVTGNVQKIDQLRRTYIRKLFAGGAEAQDLFGTLAAEIAKLTA
jgi:hypothetical protein